MSCFCYARQQTRTTHTPTPPPTTQWQISNGLNDILKMLNKSQVLYTHTHTLFYANMTDSALQVFWLSVTLWRMWHKSRRDSAPSPSTLLRARTCSHQRTYIHAYIHTYIHTFIHTYTHKHAQSIVMRSIPIVIPLVLQSAMALCVCMKVHVWMYECMFVCDLCSCVCLCCVCKGVEAYDIMQHLHKVIQNV